MKYYKGFTLVELLIASSIYVVIMVSVYSAFHSGIFGYKNIEESARVSQQVFQVLERVNLDLKNSFAFSEDDNRFKGSKDILSFFTLVDTFDGESMQKEYSFVSYSLNNSFLTRLCKKGQESLKEPSEIQPEEMPVNIQEFSFEYGKIETPGKPLVWASVWEDLKLLPAAVKVKLVLKNKAQETYERTIFLTSQG